MNLLLSEYMRRCRENYKPLGFQRNKQTYARVVGDVLQRFTLFRYSSGRSCTIEFGVVPLCMNIPYLDTGGYSMEKFVIKKDLYSPAWPYNAASLESVTECLDQLFSCFEKNVLPLFERADSCETAFPELQRMRDLFEDNYYKRLSLYQMEGRRDISNDRFYNFPLLYIALKSRNYDYAKKSLEMINSRGIARDRKLYSTMLEQLLAGDTKEIDALLQRNEAESLQTIQTLIKIK